MFHIGAKDAAKLRRNRTSRRNQKPGKSENSLHWHVAHLLETHLAEPAWFTTFPAGGGGEMRGTILKGLGLKSGVPDILIVNPVAVIFNGELTTMPMVYWIELKKAKSGQLSDAQLETHPRLHATGCVIAVCETLEQVQAALHSWRLPYQSKTPNEQRFSASIEKTFGQIGISD